jgi:hypothetical protein
MDRSVSACEIDASISTVILSPGAWSPRFEYPDEESRGRKKMVFRREEARSRLTVEIRGRRVVRRYAVPQSGKT